jgi:AcrR family transcriptional regulator
MGPKQRREREREEIRGKILDAAREMFVTEGFDSVTMRRIAERIEYSPTAIYFHFKDKEALLRELCATDFRTLAEQFYAIAQIADPIERLRRTGHAYVQFGLNNPGHYRMMFMTPHPPVNSTDVDLEKGNPEQDAYAFLKAIIVQAVAEKLLTSDDVDLISQTMWAGVHGVISLQIAKCNDDWIEWRDVDKRADMMIEALIAGLVRRG